MRSSPGALILAASAGASAWISLGVLAVTNDAGRRLGAVPPVWLLVASIVAACVVARLARVRARDLAPLALTLVLWLPWLPVSIPPAFLVWEGPLEIAVWVAAVGGVLVPREPPTSFGALLMNPRMAPWIAAVLFAVCSLASAAALDERIPGGDEPHYLIITQSLLADGDLRIQNNHERGDYLSYHHEVLPPDFLRRGANGEIYSIHAPGISILLLPFFALFGYPGAVVCVALVSSVAVALGWRTAHRLTQDVSAAWAATAATALSAPVLFHSFAIFPDPVAAAIVSLGLWLVVRLELREATNTWQLAGIGTLVGVLPWLHTRLVVIAAAVGAVVALRLVRTSERRRSLIAFFAGPGILAIAWFAFFWIVYGTPDPAAPYGEGRQHSVAWIGRGLIGLAFDQQFGLLTSAPVIMFAVDGLARLARWRPRLAADLAAISIPYVLVIASFGMWWGGWSAPARFLIPVVPIVVPLLALTWPNASRPVRCTFVALALIAALNVVARVTLLDGLLLYNFRDGYDLLLDWASRSVDLPVAFPSVHRSGARTAALLAAIWVGVGAIALGAITLGTKHRAFTRQGAWLVTGAVGAVALIVAVSAGWRVADVSAERPDSSKADFVRRWNPRLRPLVWTLPDLHRAPSDAVGQLRLRASTRTLHEGEPAPLFAFDWLPAAEYRVVIEGAATQHGVLQAAVGKDSQPLETWSLGEVPAGVTSLTLRLPGLVRLLTIRGDEAARGRISRLSLMPVSVPDGSSLDRHIARAARYGNVRTFFLDDEAYVEPDGMWTRGNSTTRIVTVAEQSPASLDLQAGPRPITVRLTADEWSVEAVLTAGERRLVEVPTGKVLVVQTDGAFRPVDHDPNVRDQRSLGVRLAFRN